MPSVQKQTVRKNVQAPSNGQDAWGMVDTLRVLVYGQSGTGKTTFWATFPGPILALICSGGNKPGELRSIDTPENRKKVTPRIVDSVAGLRDELRRAGDFATVVLDHASGLQDLTLKEILGMTGDLPAQKSWGLATQQQYGQSTLQCKELLREMLNLPANIVIVAQERVFGGRDEGLDPEIIRPMVGAAVTPSLLGWLNPACDYVVQAFKRPKLRKTVSEVAGKKIESLERERGAEYCLRTEPHETFMTKFRLPRGRELPDAIVNPTYDKLVRIIRGEK